jgi:hypothetical protein
MPIDLQTDNGLIRPRGDAGKDPAGARACTAAQYRTTRAQRPTSAVRACARSTAGRAGARARRPAVHVENPAGRLARLRAHNTRHERQHEKQETGMHARGMCTHPRPTAADCHHPPGEPPTPRPRVYPPCWGSGNFDDRISKASCYVVLLTFFLKFPAAIPWRWPVQKNASTIVRKNCRKTPARIPISPTGYLSEVT